MSIMNNVNVSMLAQVAEEAKTDKSKIKKSRDPLVVYRKIFTPRNRRPET